jgi:hypothetical protein
MNFTLFTLPRFSPVRLECVWIGTGDPAHPLECRWIPRRLTESGAASASTPGEAVGIPA